MSATIGTNRALKTTCNKSKRLPLDHRALVKYHMASLETKVPVTDDADRTYLIDHNLQSSFWMWNEELLGTGYGEHDDDWAQYRIQAC